MFGFGKKNRQPRQPRAAEMERDLGIWMDDFLAHWTARCEAARTPYEREWSHLQEQRVLLEAQISLLRAQQERDELLRQSAPASAPVPSWSIREIPRRDR